MMVNRVDQIISDQFAPFKFQTNTWYTLALKFDNGTIYAYIDNTLYFSQSGLNSSSMPYTQPHFTVERCDAIFQYIKIWNLNAISSNNSLTSNICENNRTYGIYLAYSSYNNLTNNTCNNNSVYGIALDNSSNNNCINGVCSGNTDKDIRIGSGCNYNIFDLFWSTASDSGTGNVLIKPPNMPIILSPSTRQTTTSPTISAYDNDNYPTSISGITVYFYDNSCGGLIGSSVLPKTGGTASAIWGGLTRGNTCTFFAVGQDNYGAWSSNSNTQTFGINSLTTAPTSLSLSPSTIYVGTTLTATAGGSTDVDGDTITYYYKFYNQTDGVESQAYSNSNTYTMTTADAHDNIMVFAKAYDGYENSDNFENSEIVANTLPTTPTTLTLTSSVNVGDLLMANASGSTDVDGDSLTYCYEFYNVTDGVTRQAYSTTNSYTTQQGDANDNIVIFTKAYDGYGYSGEKENSIIIATIQYYLNVTSSYDTPTPPSGWFDNGTIITENVTSPVPGGSGTQYVCTGWTGTGSVPTSGTGTSVTFTITAPSSITWNWKTQYYLTLTTSPSVGASLIGAGWYDSGASASISTDNIVPIDSGSRYRFNGWTTDNMDEIADASSTSTTVTMDSAKTVTANYTMQYYLTVTSPYGTTGGEGWYDNGTTANATVTPLIVSEPPEVQHVFTNWSGDATGTTSPSNPIIMNAPKTAIANWETQ
jgi:parallel beta-helix repeat protein